MCWYEEGGVWGGGGGGVGWGGGGGWVWGGGGGGVGVGVCVWAGLSCTGACLGASNLSSSLVNTVVFQVYVCVCV